MKDFFKFISLDISGNIFAISSSVTKSCQFVCAYLLNLTKSFSMDLNFVRSILIFNLQYTTL